MAAYFQRHDAQLRRRKPISCQVSVSKLQRFRGLFHWIDDDAASFNAGSVVIYAVRCPSPPQSIFVRIFLTQFFCPRAPQAVRFKWVPFPVTTAVLFEAIKVAVIPRFLDSWSRDETASFR
jgi:hypothetical protein